MSTFSAAIRIAESHLDAAVFCLGHDRHGLAASEAYYAMYHATRAWALQEPDDPPGTHKGMGLFLHRLVVNGRLDARLRDHFHDARAARERWHYEGVGPLPTTTIEDVVEAAESLVEEALSRS